MSKSIKERLTAAEQQVSELWPALRIKTDDFTVKDAAPAFQLAGQTFTKSGEAFERVPIAGDQTDAISVGIEQRTETIPFELPGKGLARYLSSWLDPFPAPPHRNCS